MDEKCGYKTPTPADSPEQQIIDPSFPKNEREWWASEEITRLRAEVEALRNGLDSIRQYGSDTLSGRTDGPDDRAWQRAAVLEMTNRAIRALKGK